MKSHLINKVICTFPDNWWVWTSIQIFLLLFFYFTILYWFCHTSTWICHWCTRVRSPEPPSHLLPRTIPLGHRSAPAPSILYHSLNLDWCFVSHMITYMFQCHSLKSSHPCLLPESPKVCSLHLCLFCCLTYSVIITIFPPSSFMVVVRTNWNDTCINLAHTNI